MKERIRYVLALVVGLLAIPGLALATNAVLAGDSDDDGSGADEVGDVSLDIDGQGAFASYMLRF